MRSRPLHRGQDGTTTWLSCRVGSKRGGASVQSPIVSTLGELDRYRYMSLATFRRSGAEVATPVWFAMSGGKLYVFTAGDSGKVKRLRHTSRARVAPSDGRGLVQGGWRSATAALVTDSQVIERAHAALRTKYGWQILLADLFSRLTGRFRRRAWIEVELHAEAASTNRRSAS